MQVAAMAPLFLSRESVPEDDKAKQREIFDSQLRDEGKPELRHDHFMEKVPSVIGETLAPKFLGSNIYLNDKGGNQTRSIYNFPKRKPMLMATSYSYILRATVYDALQANRGQDSYSSACAEISASSAKLASFIFFFSAAIRILASRIISMTFFTAGNAARHSFSDSS